jgi:superfamily II DNA or RNA helicase
MGVTKKARLRLVLELENKSNSIQLLCDGAPTIVTDNEHVQQALKDLGCRTKVRLLARLKTQTGAESDKVQLKYINHANRDGVDIPQRHALKHSLDEATLKKRVRATLTTRKDVTPLRPQQAIIDYFDEFVWYDKTLYMRKPFVINWHMGAGKTLAVLFTLLRSRHPPRKVVVVCSKTLVGQWAGAVRFLGMSRPTSDEDVKKRPYNEHNTLVHIVGVTCFKNECDTILTNADVAVVDEFHEWRSYTNPQRFAVDHLAHMRNMFLLSGTPLVNGPGDMRGWLALMGEQLEVTGGENGTVVWTNDENRTMTVSGPKWNWPMDAVSRVMNGNVSVFDPKVHAADDYASTFPHIEHKTWELPMSPAHMLHYMQQRGASHPVKFNVPNNWPAPAATRQDKSGNTVLTARTTCRNNRYNYAQVVACNEADITTGVAAKPDALVRFLADPKNHARALPTVVFSPYIHTGITTIMKALQANSNTSHLPMASIIGEVPARERDEVVEKFNNKEIQILFLSKAGGTGVSLRGARSQFIFGICGNLSTEQQINGRVVRMDSHPDGHKSTVLFVKLMSTFPMTKLAHPSTLTKKERETLLDYVMELWPAYFNNDDVMERVNDEDIVNWACRELRRVAEEEEGGKTINEQFNDRNIEKDSQIATYRKMLLDNSIKMPKGCIRTPAPQPAYMGMSPKKRATSLINHITRKIMRKWVTNAAGAHCDLKDYHKNRIINDATLSMLSKLPDERKVVVGEEVEMDDDEDEEEEELVCTKWCKFTNSQLQADSEFKRQLQARIKDCVQRTCQDLADKARSLEAAQAAKEQRALAQAQARQQRNAHKTWTTAHKKLVATCTKANKAVATCALCVKNAREALDRKRNPKKGRAKPEQVKKATKALATAQTKLKEAQEHAAAAHEAFDKHKLTEPARPPPTVPNNAAPRKPARPRKRKRKGGRGSGSGGSGSSQAPPVFNMTASVLESMCSRASTTGMSAMGRSRMRRSRSRR